MAKTGSINLDKFGAYQLFGDTFYVNVGGKQVNYYQYYYGLKGHHGIDTKQKTNFSVYAETKGTVIGNYSAAEGGSAGRYIVIRTPLYGQTWRYLHLNKSLVKLGQKVERGQKIGLAGKTGAANNIVHLHFDYRPRIPNIFNGYKGYKDPLGYLKKYK